MQVTETNQDGLKHEFKVVIDASDLAQKVDLRLGELANQVRIPGFRPGKVPTNVLKQRYGDAVLGEVMEQAVNDSASQALQERGMRPAMEPKIEVQEYKQGADLEYTLAIEVLPEVEPMDFTTIALERMIAKVPEADIDQTLEHLAGSHKDTKPLDEPRAAVIGDVAIVDFVGRIDGAEFPGGAAEDYHLELGSGMFIPGFEEQLLGKNAGEETGVNVSFPDDYGNDELKGKPAEFSVTIKEIRESVPAVIDDEFAKANGLESLAALRNSVRDTLQNNYDQVTEGRLKRDLLDKLAGAHDFAVPPGMVAIEFDTIWRQIEEAREKDELEEEDKAKSEDELKAEYQSIAERRVRLGLLLSEVGQRAKIEVTDQEVSQAVMAEAQRHQGQEREVFEIYQKNPAARAHLRAPIFENKVVDYILELAKVEVREVSPEDLLKADEAESAEEPEKKADVKKKSAKKSAAKASSADKSS
ncbi:MAG TPA: trigger factor [Alphaproteobacteria bacterium]|nr:trigger factor [Alphaproteobacteria bacterium]